jgi:hypothetical protein
MTSKILGLLAVGLLAGPASTIAAQVTVTGGFTSFQGPGAQAPATASVHVNTGGGNVNYAPTTDLNGDGYGLGPKLMFSPVTTLTFGCTTLSGLDFCNAGDNEFSFAGLGPQDVSGTGPANPFLLGVLTVTDGSWFPNVFPGDGTLLTSIGFQLTTSSADAAFNNQTLDAVINFESIFPNKGDVICFSGITVDQSAECQTIPNSLNSAARVSRSFNLYGYIGSLHLGAVQAVPEPGTLALLSLGLAGLGLSRRRKG